MMYGEHNEAVAPTKKAVLVQRDRTQVGINSVENKRLAPQAIDIPNRPRILNPTKREELVSHFDMTITIDAATNPVKIKAEKAMVLRLNRV